MYSKSSARGSQDTPRPVLDLQKIKSLIPYLAAESDDLVLTTVRAIRRCLSDTGHDLNDLADLLGPRKPITHRDIARSVLEHPDHRHDLNEKEIEFLRVMSRSPYCSARQVDWLDALRCRFF